MSSMSMMINLVRYRKLLYLNTIYELNLIVRYRKLLYINTIYELSLIKK